MKYPQIINHLQEKLKRYFQNAKIQKAVIGISGGVDSAVTLAIAVQALGKENIIGVCMPYKVGEFSSKENFQDAKDLCKTMQIETRIIEIDDFAKPFLSLFTTLHSFGNTLARIRMTILFGIANEEQALVLGTCNKSEVLLGYETKFGDGAADISVIGDLWKTDIWEIAKCLKLPEHFITKIPSAELYEGHSDEKELGFSYSIADEVLKKIEKGESLSDTPLNNKILDLWKSSAHKRNSIPILLMN